MKLENELQARAQDQQLKALLLPEGQKIKTSSKQGFCGGPFIMEQNPQQPKNSPKRSQNKLKPYCKSPKHPSKAPQA